MVNSLTPFIPTLFAQLDKISREQVGFITSVERDTASERAAVGQTIAVPISQAGTLTDIVPGMVIPEPTDRELDSVNIVITKSKSFSFGLTGEETQGLNTGIGSNAFMIKEFLQGARALTNEMEEDIAIEVYKNASRAYGTAGGTPFSSTLSEAAQINKILNDNGAPAGRSLILDSTAGANLRSLAQLTKVNEAGTEMTLRDGSLLDIFGFGIKESAKVQTPDIGTAVATADVDTAGYEIGATSIVLASAGTNAIIAGDYVTFAGQTHKYLVVTGVADVSTGGTLVIAKPGLMATISTDASQAVTVVAKSTRNVGFSSSAIQLVTRAPALPEGDDSAVDSYMMVDPRSGISFEVRLYKGYHKVRAEIGCAWGTKAIKPEHIGCLLG